MCALRLARDNNKKIYILAKSNTEENNTRYAQGGVALSLGNEKDIESHIKDTLIAGRYLNEKSIVKRIVQKSSDIVNTLKSIGVDFDDRPTREGGHGKSRVYHTKDTTGESIEFCLIKAIKKHKNIQIYDYTFVTELLVKKGRCIGCRAINNDKEKIFIAKNIVLATGGVGQLYKYTTNPKCATGDGVALAAEKGARIKDMEFIQFHPTALKEKANPLLLLSEALRGEGAYLVNKKGERFMKKYDECEELAPRDVVTKAIFQEQKRGGVYLDFRHKEAKWIREHFPMLTREIQKRTGKKLWEDLIEITPAAHYLCGGIDVDMHGRTSIKGLYAIGETARTGLHGANRLASNSLLEGAAFGLFAAEDIEKQKISKSKKNIKVSRIAEIKHHQPQITKKRLLEMRKNVQETLWKWVGITRNKDDLIMAIEKLKLLLQKMPKTKTTSVELEEVRHMIICGLLIAKNALKRKKSIGCHWRVDSDSSI